MKKTKRTSMSLPEDLIDDLDYCSRKMSVTRSSIVTEMLSQGVTSLKYILEQAMPDNDSIDKPLRRSSSEVAELLRDQLSHVRNMVDSTDANITAKYLGGSNDDRH